MLKDERDYYQQKADVLSDERDYYKDQYNKSEKQIKLLREQLQQVTIQQK